jgi:hypothetical protein
MPILPGLCDDDASLAAVVRATADHGGKFVLAGSLTLADQQHQYFLRFLAESFPQLLLRYQGLYPPGSYGPQHYPWPTVARRIRDLCAQFGIRHRVPRPIIPGDKRAINKRIVELLADQIYALEIDGAPSHRIWELRRAAWAVEDLEQDIAAIYQAMGLKGLQSIQGIGPSLAQPIERMLSDLKDRRASLGARE